jgi:outer membrane protein TolC
MKKRIVPAMLALVLAFGYTNVYAARSSSAATAKTTVKTTAQTAAEDDGDDSVLTVDEAVSKAIAYSRTLKTLYENNEINELTASDTRTTLVASSEYIELTNLNVELKNLMNSMTNYDSNVAIEKENIRLNIIQLFAGIISAEDSIKLYEKQIELNERDLKIAQVKSGLGLLSTTDYDALVVSNDKVKSSKQSLEIAVEEAYTSLNQILGQNLSNTYKVSLDVEYEALGDVDLDYAVSKAISSSQTIKEKDEAATIAKYKLDVYSVEYSGGYKESAQSSYAQATRALADAKTSMEANLRSTYNKIQTAETEYNNNLKSLEQKQKELSVKELQLQLGKITQLEYDKAEYEIEQLENTIKQSVYSHYVLVTKFNNPDLL